MYISPHVKYNSFPHYNIIFPLNVLNLRVLFDLPSFTTSPPQSLLLFLSICLEFPLTVLQLGSIWKCFLKGREAAAAEDQAGLFSVQKLSYITMQQLES